MQHPKLNSHMLPWPTDWAAIFGREKPLIAEIGFGNGDYTVALAQAHPDCNVVGFEVSNVSLEKAERKIVQRGLTNARAVHSRGETALHHLFKPQSLREIHINYPDPWFKTRHAGRRIMQRDTLDAIVSRLEIGGIFYLATDIVDYAEMSHDLLADTPGLDNLLSAPYINDFSERLITTKYEAKGIEEGRAGNYFKYQRNDRPIPTIPVQEDYDVPHVVLETPMTPQEIASRVERDVFHKGDIHVAVFNGYWNPQYDSVLLEINIEEPTIEQHVALSLRRRDTPTAYTLRYATFGMPRPTDGMHFATHAVAKWIVDLHPDAQVLIDKTRR